jgi:hypothetical protein
MPKTQLPQREAAPRQSPRTLNVQMEEENPLLELLTTYGPKIAYTLIGLLIVGFLLFRFTADKKTEALTDYLNAQTYFDRFKSSPVSQDLASNESYTQLLMIMDRHPELHAKYDGILSQILLARGDIQQAQTFAERTFNRVNAAIAPDYVQFSQSTLDIAKGDAKTAYANAQTLKQQMDADITASGETANGTNFGPVLYGFNELRLAFLAQNGNAAATELAALNRLNKLLKEASDPAKMNVNSLTQNGHRALMAHLRSGSINLFNYIDYRKKNLK